MKKDRDRRILVGFAPAEGFFKVQAISLNRDDTNFIFIAGDRKSAAVDMDAAGLKDRERHGINVVCFRRLFWCERAACKRLVDKQCRVRIVL